MIIIYNSHLILGLFVQVCTWRAQWRGPHHLQSLPCETIGQAFYWVRSMVVVGLFVQVCTWRAQWRGPHLLQVLPCETIGQAFYWVKLVVVVVVSSYPRSFRASSHLKSPMKRPVPLAKPPMWDNWTSILLGQVRDGDGGGGGRGWLQFITLLSYPRFFCASSHLKSPLKWPAPLTKPPMWDNWTSILLGQVHWISLYI